MTVGPSSSKQARRQYIIDMLRTSSRRMTKRSTDELQSIAWRLGAVPTGKTPSRSVLINHIAIALERATTTAAEAIEAQDNAFRP